MEDPDVFDESTDARTELVKNFLTAINIPRSVII